MSLSKNKYFMCGLIRWVGQSLPLQGKGVNSIARNNIAKSSIVKSNIAKNSIAKSSIVKSNIAKNSIAKMSVAVTVLICSLSAFGVGDRINCDGNTDIQKYNEGKEWLKNTSSPYYLYNLYRLGLMSVCMGKPEAMSYFQQASDLGHIVSTLALGEYYETSQSFDSSQAPPATQEDLDAAIYYYKKAGELVNNTPNYPKGASKDMYSFERNKHFSYRIFTRLPYLYFHGYNQALEDIIISQEKIIYTDSLNVLSRMRDSAQDCLERPALSVWKDDKQRIYSNQQTTCGAFFDFANQALPLEQERMAIVENCTTPLSECSKHQEIYSQINQLRSVMFSQLSSEEF